MLLSIHCAFLSSVVSISGGTRLVIVKRMSTLAVIYYVSREIEKKVSNKKGYCKTLSNIANNNTPYFRIFSNKINPLPIGVCLPSPSSVYLYQLYISEGKITKTKILTSGKAKSFFQQ